MEITKNDVYEACKDLGINANLHNLIANMLYYEEIDKDTDADKLARDCIDNYLIYDSNIWEIMQTYQKPQYSNYYEAVECFTDDLTKVIKYLKRWVKSYE